MKTPQTLAKAKRRAKEAGAPGFVKALEAFDEAAQVYGRCQVMKEGEAAANRYYQVKKEELIEQVLLLID